MGNFGLVLLIVGFIAAAVFAKRETIARDAVWLGLSGGAISMTFLAYGFATENWRLDYVANHTRTGLSLPIRVAGLWGGAEGSLLMWTFMLAVVALIANRVQTSVWSTRIGAALVAGYGIVVLTVSNPFETRASVPANGNGLQPILENPAMQWHPPILYMGLAGVILPTLLLVGAYLGKATVSPAIKRATLIGWGLLTLGLATGAAWAHSELGWGGYWAWDPIENAGLVAWLATGGVIHISFSAIRNKGTVELRSALLGSLPGIAAVWASTVTRMGTLTSVHSFADQPRLRVALVSLSTVFSLGLFAAIAIKRGLNRVEEEKSAEQPSSEKTLTFARDRTRRGGGAFLFAAAVIVATGTYEPVIGATFGNDVSITAGSFYTRLLWPILIIAAIVVLRFDKAWLAALGSGAAAVASTPYSVGVYGLMLAFAGGAVVGSSVWRGLGARILTDTNFARKGWLSHAGMGLLLVGIAGTFASSDELLVLETNQPQTFGGTQFVHRGVEIVDTGATKQVIATVELRDANSPTAEPQILQPSIVAFNLRPTDVAGTKASAFESDTTGLWGSRQLRLLDAATERAQYRYIQTPRVFLVWVGATITALGLFGAMPNKTLKNLRRFKGANKSKPALRNT